MWNEYKVDGNVFRTTDATTLWKTDQGFVEVDGSTLVVAVKSGEKQEGYVFHGRGKMVLDAIVETDAGAIGESIEKQLNEPFLMMVDTDEIQQRLAQASTEDLTKMSYKSGQDFVEIAEKLVEKSLNQRRMGINMRHNPIDGSMFIFPSKVGRPDVLMVRDSKLIYKSGRLVFISDDGKSMLKSPEHVLMSRQGKCCIACK